MKKLATLCFTVVLGVFLMVLPSAATNCHSADGIKVGKTDATAAESAIKTAKADKVNEVGKTAQADDGLSLVTLGVVGMTCGGCEAHVSKTLKACNGVTEVVEVSHKDNKAVVKYDPAKTGTDVLVSSIKKLGYKVDIQPAVAKTTINAETTKDAIKTEDKKTTKDM